MSTAALLEWHCSPLSSSSSFPALTCAPQAGLDDADSGDSGAGAAPFVPLSSCYFGLFVFVSLYVFVSPGRWDRHEALCWVNVSERRWAMAELLSLLPRLRLRLRRRLLLLLGVASSLLYVKLSFGLLCAFFLLTHFNTADAHTRSSLQDGSSAPKRSRSDPTLAAASAALPPDDARVCVACWLNWGERMLLCVRTACA